MICPHYELTGEPWGGIPEMGFVCRCRHPDNSGNQGYVRAGVPAGELRPSGHCSPRCVFLALDPFMGSASTAIACIRTASKRVAEMHAEAEKTKTEANERASDIIAQAKRLSDRTIAGKQSEISRLDVLLTNAHKEFGYRKNLPDTHERLKQRFEELKEKCGSLSEELKEVKAAAKKRDNEFERQRKALGPI